jgi:formylglycine-generating enzyme required for sulfatase activity/pimeloyl-ACP methyl ester carboxylesterase
MAMVYVPAGTFEMGNLLGDDQFGPHTVTLDGFWIDQTEVTNTQYAAFLNDRGNQMEGGMTWLEVEQVENAQIEYIGGIFKPEKGKAEHPVVEVSWYGAAAFCEWVGGRLPTEAEWEYAARGPENNIYPWGNDAPTCDLSQFGGCGDYSIPAGSLSSNGDSWIGAKDMAGNVWEWTADFYGEYPLSAQTNPAGPMSGERKVTRGGSYFSMPDTLHTAYRSTGYLTGAVPNVGFRCAASIPSTTSSSPDTPEVVVGDKIEIKPVFEPDICQFSPPFGYEMVCGYLIVPENRRRPDSRSIRIHVAIFKSTNPNPKPDPVIYVAGGGGVNQLYYSEHYLNNGGDEILKDRDYIMYNQRGAQLNEPSLVCPDNTDLYWTLAKQNLSAREQADHKIGKLLECQDDLIEQGIDLTAYNTIETAADVNDLRVALGYEEVNLYGTSSGTRTILTIMRNQPEGIRSVILDSVYPPQVNLYSTHSFSVHRVFSLLFQECAASPECNQKYPNLEATFYQTVDDLNTNPVSVALSRGTVLVDGGFFMEAVYVNFYTSDSIPQIPGWVNSASQGHFSGLKNTFESLLFDSRTSMAMGYEWSMQCNEEVSFESYEKGHELSADLPHQIAEYFDSYYEFKLCESWQSGQAEPIENIAVISDIPALVFAGQFDPITPPDWGRLAAETLSRHFFYEFPGLGHGIMRSNQCGLEIGLQFIDDPISEPDSACMSEVPEIDFK